jgi:hypothetical protein
MAAKLKHFTFPMFEFSLSNAAAQIVIVMAQGLLIASYIIL